MSAYGAGANLVSATSAARAKPAPVERIHLDPGGSAIGNPGATASRALARARQGPGEGQRATGSAARPSNRTGSSFSDSSPGIESRPERTALRLWDPRGRPILGPDQTSRRRTGSIQLVRREPSMEGRGAHGCGKR